MSNFKLTRRHLLTSSGAVFTLPLLEALYSRSAQAAGGDPRRFVSVYMPNGTYNRLGDAPWYPPVGPMTANLPLVLAPFAANKGDFSVLAGVKCAARSLADRAVEAALGKGGGHVSAVTTWLSQVVFTNPASTQCSVPGSSFDQLLAQSTQKAALVLCGGMPNTNPDGMPFNYATKVSFDNGRAVEPNMNPGDLYDRMFKSLVPTPGGGTAPPAPTTAAIRNKSVLDSVRQDIKKLQSQLGKNDNAKLDDYFTSVRNLETRLAAVPPVPPVGSQCGAGTAPTSDLYNTDVDGNQQNYIARVTAFFDMIVLAFKCDLTRSVSFMFDGDTGGRHLNAQVPSNLVVSNVSMTAGTHTGVSHYGQNAQGREKCITRDRLFMLLVVHLIDQLKAATDPSGSPVLDNSVLYAGFNVVDGQHNGSGSAGTPVILAGGRNFIHPGNVYDASGFDLKDVLYTLSTHLGMGLTQFAGSSKLVAL